MNASLHYAILIASLTVACFFACSGWNKLFNPVHKEQMHATMNDLFGTRWGPRLYWFVTPQEFLSGVISVPAAIMGWTWVLAGCNFVMLMILAVAFGLVGYKQMMSFKPVNLGDDLACFLYVPEALLAVLALVSFVGAFS